MISKKIVIMLLLLVFSLTTLASCKEEVDEMDQVVYALSENGEYYICKGLWDYRANSSIDRESELVIEAYICGKPVLEIANHAFYGLGTTKVVIPDTVKRIGDYAFSICPNLKTITLPSSLISIGEMCFSDNKSLKSLVIPLNVQNIGKYIFAHIQNENFKVYCEHKERPDTWDEKWYYGIDEKNIEFDYKQ